MEMEIEIRGDEKMKNGESGWEKKMKSGDSGREKRGHMVKCAVLM